VRVGLVSDLHVDHHPEVTGMIGAQAARLGVDALVVAGDLSSKLSTIAGVLAELRALVPTVVYVPGNHDLWADDSRRRYLEELPAVVARAGVAYLPDGPVVLRDLALVGQTGWYDYSLADPTLDIPGEAYRAGRFGKLAWSDKRFVHWEGLDEAGLTAWMAERLAADLAALADGTRTLVVTHLLPFPEMVVRRPVPWGFVGGFLGSTRLGDVIRAARARLDVVRAWCGHTHFRVSVEVDGLRCETSPIGYPKEVSRQGDGTLAGHVRDRIRIYDTATDR
jgi:predicted phosphohydrolase